MILRWLGDPLGSGIVHRLRAWLALHDRPLEQADDCAVTRAALQGREILAMRDAQIARPACFVGICFDRLFRPCGFR